MSTAPTGKKRPAETELLLECKACGLSKDRVHDFSKTQQRQKNAAQARCKDCIENGCVVVGVDRQPPSFDPQATVCGTCQKSLVLLQDTNDDKPKSNKPKSSCDTCRKYRVCVGCHKAMPKSMFSNTQWKLGKSQYCHQSPSEAKCLQCFTPEQEKAALEEQRAERERQRQAHIEVAKPENRRKVIAQTLLEKQEKGIVHYEHKWDWRDHFETTQDGPFQHPMDEMEALPGEYKVYYCAYLKDTFLQELVQQRTTRRSMILSWNEERKCLQGVMGQISDEMSGAEPYWKDQGYVCAWEDRFAFDETRRSDSTVHFSLTTMPRYYLGYAMMDDAQTSGFDDPTQCHIRVLRMAKRAALHRIPSDDYSPEQDEVMDEFAQAPFEDLQAAEQAVHSASYAGSWLSHQHLPSQLAPVCPLIHQFYTRQPLPALFLEEGDLCLHVCWRDDGNGQGAWAYYYARKVTQQE